MTLYERILTCFIIYRNAISTFLTLFVKYVFEKKLQILCWKNNENREEVAWSFTPQEDQIKTTVCLVLYKWAVHTTVCVPPFPFYVWYIYKGGGTRPRTKPRIS